MMSEYWDLEILRSEFSDTKLLEDLNGIAGLLADDNKELSDEVYRLRKKTRRLERQVDALQRTLTGDGSYGAD